MVGIQMDEKSYEVACNVISHGVENFVKNAMKEFGDEKLKGGWFIVRVQAIAASKVHNLIKTIPKDFFDKIGMAYNKENIYLFPLFEEMYLVYGALKKFDNKLIDSVGIGWLKGTNEEFMICKFMIVGDNKQGILSTARINGLELMWLSEPIFNIQKR
jgi:hypothetical protein